MVEEQKTLGWDDILTEQEEREAPDISKPIKGKYLTKCEKIERKQFTSKAGIEFDVIEMKLKVFKDLEGDVSLNRYLDKTYFLGVSQWNDDPLNGFMQLCGALYQCGKFQEWMRDVTMDTLDDAVAKIDNLMHDAEIKVTAFPKKDKQQVRIYKQGVEAKATDDASKFAV